LNSLEGRSFFLAQTQEYNNSIDLALRRQEVILYLTLML